MPGSARMAFVWALAAWMMAVTAAATAGEGTAPRKVKPPAATTKAAESEPTLAITNERLVELTKATGLTSDVVRAGVEYIARYKPRWVGDLENPVKADPQQFRAHISSASYSARELAQLKKSDPARGARREQTLELEAQAERLCDRYKEVSEAERPQVEVELTNALAKVFDLRLEEERYQLEQLKKQVEQMETRINERTKNKDRIVDRQLTILLGINELLAW